MNSFLSTIKGCNTKLMLRRILNLQYSWISKFNKCYQTQLGTKRWFSNNILPFDQKVGVICTFFEILLSKKAHRILCSYIKNVHTRTISYLDHQKGHCFETFFPYTKVSFAKNVRKIIFIFFFWPELWGRWEKDQPAPRLFHLSPACLQYTEYRL